MLLGFALGIATLIGTIVHRGPGIQEFQFMFCVNYTTGQANLENSVSPQEQHTACFSVTLQQLRLVLPGLEIKGMKRLLYQQSENGTNIPKM